MRKRDRDTQGLADLEYLVEGGIRGAPTELTPGPEMYVPVVDELQSAMDAKESGASALAELKEGNLGAAGLDSLMAVLSALGAVPVVGRVPATVGKAIEKVFPKKIDSIGSTSLSIDTYSGITVPMTKDKFFDNVEDLKTPKEDSVSFLKEKMEDGEEIGRPFIVLEWTGTDWKPKKSFHEGRHRMIAAEEVFGKDAKIPVNVQLRNKAGNKIPIKELTGERDFYTVKDSTEADLMLTKFEEWKKSEKPKGKRAFHSTSNASELFETDIFHPVPKGAGQDIGIHVGASPYTSNNAMLNLEHKRQLEKSLPREAAKQKIEKAYQGKVSIPLRLDPDLKPLRIPDMGAFKYPGAWIRELNETDIVPEKIKKDLIEAAKEMLSIERKNDKISGYFNTREGKTTWLNKLREIGKKHGFDSFVYKNFAEGWADDTPKAMDRNPLTKELITEPEDSYMLMYPRQIKYEHSPTKDYTVPVASKRKGGSVVERNPYNYTAKPI